MFKFALVVLFFATAYARPNTEIDPYIFGGNEAKEGQFPFIVSLRIGKKQQHICGGALISDRYVVTAAHCVGGKPHLYNIGVGSTDLSKHEFYEVDKLIPHPEFNLWKIFNDIGLIRLKTPVKIGGNVQTINFPINEDLNGNNATGLGWGSTSADEPTSKILMYLNGPIIRNDNCRERLKIKIADSQLCFGGVKGQGMCFGDSGSPLLYKGSDGKNYLAGVVSFGVPCGNGFPDVFTRVSSFTDWIKENMN